LKRLAENKSYVILLPFDGTGFRNTPPSHLIALSFNVQGCPTSLINYSVPCNPHCTQVTIIKIIIIKIITTCSIDFTLCYSTHGKRKKKNVGQSLGYIKDVWIMSKCNGVKDVNLKVHSILFKHPYITYAYYISNVFTQHAKECGKLNALPI